jgi:hypothetical protein
LLLRLLLLPLLLLRLLAAAQDIRQVLVQVYYALHIAVELLY